MNDKSLDKLIASLQERAKELNCLYRIDDILKDLDEPLDVTFPKIIQAIPPGWQYPDICQAKIVYNNREYQSPDFKETAWVQSANIVVDRNIVGTVSVYYTEEMPTEDDGPFLKEEGKLINTISERISDRIQHRLIRQVAKELETTSRDARGKSQEEWPVILKMIRLTDQNLYRSIARKMLNHLCWNGVPEAEQYMQSLRTVYAVTLGPEKRRG